MSQTPHLVYICELMAEDFILTVTYWGIASDYSAELRVRGFSYHIVVWVNEAEVVFEPDEERNYRAIVPHDGNVPVDLLKAIAEELEKQFK